MDSIRPPSNALPRERLLAIGDRSSEEAVRAALALPGAPALELVCVADPVAGFDLVERAVADARPFAAVLVAGPAPAAAIERALQCDPEMQLLVARPAGAGWDDLAAVMEASDRLLAVYEPVEPRRILQLIRAFVARRLVERQREREHQELLRADANLRISQKLESVGQLAAGIAHEINTPMQYVGDSVTFLRRAFEDLLEVQERSTACVERLAERGGDEALVEAARQARESADVEYLRKQIPRAFDRTLEGIERVNSIVRAMREFGHPHQSEKGPADLNRALQNALAVCRNEYKYVADVETELGDLPMVECRLGEMNQVFLNLLVNAAHAVGEAVRGTTRRGCIRVVTRALEETVRVSIEDTGTGIPAEIRDRVFDPFFTTKPVGKGTGQGLAIARAIVVQGHGGKLTFDTAVGRGTTFHVELPVRAGARA